MNTIIAEAIEITPVPWELNAKVIYKFDINSATAIDYIALDGLSLDNCTKIIRICDKKILFEEFG